MGYVERDSYAAAALMARMEESSLDLAPIFVGEIQQLDGRELRGEVDVVCGGIPCQPYSLAGNQLGNEDDRALWHEFARIVAECEPSMVFIENVPTFVTRGWFRPLGEELCRLGFEVVDPFFISARDVGAPHRRKRVFILAHRDLDGPEAERRERELDEGERAAFGDDADGRGEELGDSDEFTVHRKRPAGFSGEKGPKAGHRGVEATDHADGGQLLPDSECLGLRDEPGRLDGEDRAGAPIAKDLGLFPPGPDDGEAWRQVIGAARHLAPAIEPRFRVVVDGVSMALDESRPDQLRCAGNAVVVAQAYVAFRQLLRWAGKESA